MKPITPFDFLAKFPEGQSVAFVGNAPDLLNHSHGGLIDSYDIVVRFNEAKIGNYAENLGRRTDILVANPYVEIYPTTCAQNLGRVGLVLCIFQQTRRNDLAAFERWVGDEEVLFTYNPDLVGLADSAHKESLTTGSYALQLLGRVLKPSRMLITGFSMFSGGTAEQSHYWTTAHSAGRRVHNFPREQEIFVQLVNAVKCAVKVTPEVWEIQSRTSLKYGKNVQTLL